MGFYIRKSIRVGPLRFNLSKSGVGISAGIRGLRVGSGPRGNYVHMGRDGIYYRAALPSGPAPRIQPDPIGRPAPAAEDSEETREIDSGAVADMTDSSAADLLAEFDRKSRVVRLAPIVGVIGALAVVWLLVANAEVWITGGVLLVTVVAFLLGKRRDDLAKTVVLLYSLEPEADRAYQQLHDGFDELKRCNRIWHVQSQGAVSDKKRHAGASSLLDRQPIALAKNAPAYVKTNVEIPSIPAGRQVLCFFPDRLLVFEGKSVGAVSYGALTIQRGTSRFIEEGTVPGDATVVDRTWRFVNKSGGPDKRFKGNRELPIALYEDIHLTSTTGLNERFQTSRVDGGRALEAAIQSMRGPDSAGSSQRSDHRSPI